MFVSIFGSFIVAFCGIGPGAIFNIYLYYCDLDPMVASSTGMYLTFFTTLVASIQGIFFKKFLYEHALYVIIMTVIGTFPGLFFQ